MSELQQRGSPESSIADQREAEIARDGAKKITSAVLAVLKNGGDNLAIFHAVENSLATLRSPLPEEKIYETTASTESSSVTTCDHRIPMPIDEKEDLAELSERMRQWSEALLIPSNCGMSVAEIAAISGDDLPSDLADAADALARLSRSQGEEGK